MASHVGFWVALLAAGFLVSGTGCSGRRLNGSGVHAPDMSVADESDASVGNADLGLSDAGLVPDAAFVMDASRDPEVYDGGGMLESAIEAGLPDASALDAGLHDAIVIDAWTHDTAAPDAASTCSLSSTAYLVTPESGNPEECAYVAVDSCRIAGTAPYLSIACGAFNFICELDATCVCQGVASFSGISVEFLLDFATHDLVASSAYFGVECVGTLTPLAH